MYHLARDKLFTLPRQNQFTRLSHSRFSKRLFTFCLFVLKVWHHENYYCSSMTANKHCSSLQGSRLPPTDEYYHTVRLWGHQIWKTNKRTSHYIACCHTNTPGVELMLSLRASQLKVECKRGAEKSVVKVKDWLWILQLENGSCFTQSQQLCVSITTISFQY